MSTRTEHDALGPAIYGSFTVRAGTYFKISNQKIPPIFLKSLGIVKLAAAITNEKLKELPKAIAKPIQKAAKEYADGKYIEDCPLDPFQAGAGTPINMNANEIIANRANQILGKQLGSYDPVHPNNHVNMAQSTNDVIPTVTKIAALFLCKKIFPPNKSRKNPFGRRGSHDRRTRIFRLARHVKKRP